ncbi:MAG: hypothetical protein AAF639_33570 [Chloroflexota bacterium]
MILWLLLLSTITGCKETEIYSAQSQQTPSQQQTKTSHPPTLDDLWQGAATFMMDIEDTGLPMGESDTHLIVNDTMRSYVHASHQSAGILDHCGTPVPFPGCVIIYESQDEGRSFQLMNRHEQTQMCLMVCTKCPCESKRDHIDQQQYPQIVRYRDINNPNTDVWVMVYEYRASVFLRRSTDGLHWTEPEQLPLTGIWQRWLMNCPASAAIESHPHTPDFYDCLVGSPPGLFVQEAGNATQPELFVFVGLGQNPGAMGCYRGPLTGPASFYRQCTHNPLIVGSDTYGPTEQTGAGTNAYFDFRTVSSADLLQVGDRFYMLYEGVRGPEPGAAGDTQFGLGLARSKTNQIDGFWEKYSGNPIMVDLPANVGLGHADLIHIRNETFLYTSIDGKRRSRFKLVWQN